MFGSDQSFWSVIKHDFMEESVFRLMSIMGSQIELATRVPRLLIKFVAEKPVPLSGTVSEVILTAPLSSCSKFYDWYTRNLVKLYQTLVY